jgi:hypothetical protein
MAGPKDRADNAGALAKNSAVAKAATAKVEKVTQAVEKALPKNTKITDKEIASAAKAGAANKSTVDGSFVQNAIKQSDSGIVAGKQALADAIASGNKSQISLARTLLAKAQDANLALNDIVKALGYDPNTGKLPGEDLPPDGGSGGGGDTGGGGGGGGGYISAPATETASLTAEAYAKQLADQEAADRVQTERTSAFAVLKTQFDKYGLGSLADQVKELILGGTSTSEVTLALRQTNEYKKRFAGNEARLKAGLNVYDEATYTNLEDAFAEIYSSYGMKELLGDSAETAQEQFAKFIGNTVAPTEVKRRFQIAQTLAMSDTDTKKAIKNLYPMLTDKDIMSYFLAPKETLPKLEVKAQAAQIGGAFYRQGLSTDITSLENYVAMGVSTEQAAAAASNIAQVLPRGTFLSELDKTGTKFTQQTAEDIFLKNSAAAINQQEQLKQKERARFQGSSGSNKFSLGTGGTQGAF